MRGISSKKLMTDTARALARAQYRERSVRDEERDALSRRVVELKPVRQTDDLLGARVTPQRDDRLEDFWIKVSRGIPGRLRLEREQKVGKAKERRVERDLEQVESSYHGLPVSGGERAKEGKQEKVNRAEREDGPASTGARWRRQLRGTKPVPLESTDPDS
jgi:hypothetical protein